MTYLSYDPDQDAYAILGVDPGASSEEIHKAYRRAAKIWHPDKSPAPDAAQHFRELQNAARILRDAGNRRRYDRLREAHLGSAARARSRYRRREAPPEAYVPMRPPPDWLARRVSVHFDAVMMTLELPRAGAAGSRAGNVLAILSLCGGMITGNVMFGALALVFWAIGRLLRHPPHSGILAWAKIIPGRKRAEYHILDQRASRYDRYEVPFKRLGIAIALDANEYRIEIEGFPTPAVPVLLRTRNADIARKCAREAGQWLQLPLVRAA